MLALLASVPAFANDWYLETGARTDRAEVSKWEQGEVEHGGEARLVRRFVDGEGWRFVLRTEGFVDQDDAMDGARALADRLGVAVAVFEVDEGRAARRADVTPGGAPAKAEGVVEGPEAEDVLKSAVAAMGDTAPLLAALRDGRVRFDYRRMLADDRVVRHTWAAQGSALYLELEPVEGKSVASRLKVVGDEAWLSVGGGAWSKQHAEKVRSTIEATGPGEVVPLVWLLGAAVDQRREFERMHVAGRGTFDGKPTTLLEYGGDATSGALALEVGADGLPVRVRFGDDAVHEFRKWSKVGGAAVPHQVSTWRAGVLSDIVEIEALDLSASLPADWVRAPR